MWLEKIFDLKQILNYTLKNSLNFNLKYMQYITKTISTKDLYFNFKNISDEVQKWTIFTVLKYSKPVYKIVPIENKIEKKYNLSDLNNFIFESKNNNEKNLATDFKKYIY